MRKVSLFIAGCVVFAFAISMFGQARNLDTIMKEIGPLWQGSQGSAALGSRGTSLLDAATPDTAKIAADAAKLEGLFKEAETEFTKLKMTEAAGMAKSIAATAGNLAKEAKTGKIADAKAAKTAIGQCKACHDKTREPDPAGGFKLKAQ
jgi:hypothetical protein